jgi:hypothetical protein
VHVSRTAGNRTRTTIGATSRGCDAAHPLLNAFPMKTKSPGFQSIDIDQLNNVIGGACANCGSGDCPGCNQAGGAAQRPGLFGRWAARRQG